MGADNWAKCPQCVVNREINYKAAKLKANESYGKVSPDEYLKLVEAADKKQPPLEYTLREDYEVYMNTDGTFRASYYASCQECGFEHAFNTEERVKLKKD